MKIPRLFGWLIATIVLVCLIGLLAPQQLPVSLYKLSLVTMGGVLGYWLDRSLFPYARPDTFMGEAVEEDFDFSDPASTECDLKLMTWNQGDTAGALLFGIAMARRAFIVSGAMLAMGLGA